MSGKSRQRQTPDAELHLRATDVLEAMTDAFIALDREWRVIYVNAEAARMGGKAPEEILGRTVWEAWPTTRSVRIEREYRRAIAERTSVQFEFQYPGPQPIWVEIHAYPSDDGLNIFFRDITERKQREQERRAFLRDVLASVTEGKLRLCDETTPLPRRLTWLGEPLPLTASTLTDLRTLVQAAAHDAGFSEERAFGLITAAGECAMNAVVHAGGGMGSVSVADGDTVQVRVEDHGRGIAVESLPRATLEKGFTTAGTLGYGFKMVLEAVDRVWLQTGPTGTTVVIEQDRLSPKPAAL
ncbi:MAG: PAS domain-containing protein [Armatimonadetes bacterium]|nr:PAS domain-containing protein [Armatimonadota bacterium]